MQITIFFKNRTNSKTGEHFKAFYSIIAERSISVRFTKTAKTPTSFPANIEIKKDDFFVKENDNGYKTLWIRNYTDVSDEVLF